jgi:DNA uptake protein ComE-like DNA-binding protein
MIRIITLAVLCVSAAACTERPDEAALPPDTAETSRATGAAVPSLDQQTMVNPETASRDELLQVPHIDAAIADAIIAARPYSDMLAVDRVLAGSMSEEQRAAVYTSLWKPMDLNTASREEILLIPDVDPRMPHEFDEYRPYTDMEQFRREIGKYVDAEEVARYERYVVIRQ